MSVLQLGLGLSLEVDTVSSFIGESLQHVRIEDVLVAPGTLLPKNSTDLNDRNTYDVTESYESQGYTRTCRKPNDFGYKFGNCYNAN